MTEKSIERNLVKATESRGGIAIKITSPSMSGLPDRLIMLPTNKTGWVECKATGQKLRALQLRRKKQLERLGQKCYVLDDADKIGGILDDIQNR